MAMVRVRLSSHAALARAGKIGWRLSRRLVEGIQQATNAARWWSGARVSGRGCGGYYLHGLGPCHGLQQEAVAATADRSLRVS